METTAAWSSEPAKPCAYRGSALPGCGGASCVLPVLQSEGCCTPRCRLLVAVAQSLADLAQPALDALSSGTVSPWQGSHLAAGIGAISGCSLLAADAVELSAAATFKVAAACSMVFGPGTALLDMQLQQALADASTAIEAVRLRNKCRIQLEAVASVFNMLTHSHHQKAAAAFASSTGKPTALLPWLLTVSRALLVAGATLAPAIEPGKC